MKKTLSILLALVLLLSALPLTASAVTTDIAGTGLSYNLWLGSTQVTDDNKDDIFGDGSASFSSSAFTLTLNDPEIPGVHTDSSGDDYKIYFSGLRRLIIKGSYMMSSAESKFGRGGSGMLSRTSLARLMPTACRYRTRRLCSMPTSETMAPVFGLSSSWMKPVMPSISLATSAAAPSSMSTNQATPSTLS